MTDDAQVVLLARAFEETDERGDLVSFSEREVRAARARGQLDGGADRSPRAEDVVVTYARSIVALLRDRVARLDELLAITRPGRRLTWVLVGLALVIGLATSALGPERRINVLAVPLLGLIAWNVGVVVFVLATALTGRRAPAPSLARTPELPSLPSLPELDVPDEPTARGPVRWLWHVSLAGLSRLGKKVVALKQRDGVLVTDCAMRFVSLWGAATRRVTTLRMSATLHTAALAMVAGAVAGMYLRGVAFEYRATWESTFLQQGAVQALLDAFLALPSAVLGLEVPSVEGLRAPEGHGPAETWIHLYAMAALLYVGVPRGVMGVVQWTRARLAASRLRVDTSSGWARRLVAPVAGSARAVDVVPYSHRPGARAVDTLKALLHHVYGVRAEVALREPVDYGAVPPADWTADDGEGRTRVVLFSLSQSPESEVHAEFVDDARRDLADGERIAVLVDASDFARRVALGGREEERRRAWDGVLRELGLTCAHVNLDAGVDDDAVTAVTAATWPGGVA